MNSRESAAGIADPGYNDLDHERAILRKGVDPRKDQSYFLFSLRQEQLRHALTPLGRMSKSEIRAIARKLGLKVADKPDSQEICFVPGQDYKAFLRSHLGENQFHRGEIYDLDGNFIATHDGIEMFTIGQRKGLPGGSAQPRYVVDLDPETNRVIVGQAEDLLVEEFEIDRVNWIAPRQNYSVTLAANGGRSSCDTGLAGARPSRGSWESSVECTVKIRYNHPGTRATLMPLENQRARLRLREPQKAVTPGQATVFYDDDLVLGGGWICRQSELVAA